MLSSAKEKVRKFLNKFGYEIVKLENHIAHADRSKWLQQLGIETIIDVGANEGQFALQINKILPGKKIIAFEPLGECYRKLVKNTEKLDISAYNYALSDYNGAAEINVSANKVCSSILPMESITEEMYVNSEYTDKESIQTVRLDDVIKKEAPKKNILLKIDVQGYEEKVLLGGTETLDLAAAVLIETSFVHLYNQQWLFHDVYDFIVKRGFVFLGFADQPTSKATGIPLYGDGIFIKSELVKKVL